MYTAFYELSQEPFHVTPDPDFLFPSPAHKEALAAIVYGIEQRKGFVAVTGEVGVGKTTILRSYLDLADRKNLKLIYIYNSNLSFDDLLTTLFAELEIPDKPETTFLAVTRLHEELIEIYRKNATVVLIIDEAQNMPVETLESLRMLSNLETVTEKLIQIMMIGQPEFDEMLQQHRLRQLRQRIAIHARIGPLTVEDSIAYLEHRIQKVALSSKPVFTKQALRMIAEAAQGIPRTLNILSDNALITGFGYQIRPVNAKIVKEVLADRQLVPEAKRSRAGLWLAGGAAAAVAAAIAGFVALRPHVIGGQDVQLARSGSTAGYVEPPGEFDRAVGQARTWFDHLLQGTSAQTPPEQAQLPAAPAPRPSETSQSREPEPAPNPPAGRTSAPPPKPQAAAPATPPASPPPAAPAPAADAAPSNPAPEPPATPERADTHPSPMPPAATAAAPSPTSRRVAEAPAASKPEPDHVAPAAVAESPERKPASSPPQPATRSGSSESTTNTATAARTPSQPAPRSSATAAAPSRAAAPPAPARPPAPPPASPPQVAYAAPISPPPSPPAAEVLEPPAPRTSAATRSDHFTRTVRFGDNLWTMAEDVYGYVNPNVLRKVQDANPNIRNVNVLTPGQEILFPRNPESVSGRSMDFLTGNAAPLPSTGRN